MGGSCGWKNGKIVCSDCKNNREGDTCEKCKPKYFPSSGDQNRRCENLCTDRITCSGSGTCKNDGTCACSSGWKGASCDLCTAKVLVDVQVMIGVHSKCPPPSNKVDLVGLPAANVISGSIDFNKKAGGKYIWLCVTYDDRGKRPGIKALHMSSSGKCPKEYTRINQISGNGDFLQGAGGKDIYLCKSYYRGYYEGYYVSGTTPISRLVAVS